MTRLPQRLCAVRHSYDRCKGADRVADDLASPFELQCTRILPECCRLVLGHACLDECSTDSVRKVVIAHGRKPSGNVVNQEAGSQIAIRPFVKCLQIRYAPEGHLTFIEIRQSHLDAQMVLALQVLCQIHKELIARRRVCFLEIVDVSMDIAPRATDSIGPEYPRSISQQHLEEFRLNDSPSLQSLPDLGEVVGLAAMSVPLRGPVCRPISRAAPGRALQEICAHLLQVCRQPS
jgi:hypothetical protein